MFSASKTIVLVPDLWPWLCGGGKSCCLVPDGWSWWQQQPHGHLLSWPLCGASTRALAPAENRSSSPSFRYLQMNMALVDPNLNLGTERGVSWGGRHPALIPHSKHGQLQSGIRPLLTTLPSQVVNFSQGWRSCCSSGMEILLFLWAGGPALDHPHS